MYSSASQRSRATADSCQEHRGPVRKSPGDPDPLRIKCEEFFKLIENENPRSGQAFFVELGRKLVEKIRQVHRVQLRDVSASADQLVRTLNT